MNNFYKAMIVLLCGFVIFMVFRLRPRSWWETRPAENGKWRSCHVRVELGAMLTGCGSPMSFDEAEWWTRTKGGQASVY